MRALFELAGVTPEIAEDVDAAFVHESAAKEIGGASNERMEFLGDAVLGLVTARWLYAAYPTEKEGTLAKRKAAIVSDSAIARSADRLGFGDLMILGAGERAQGAVRPSILAAAFESFVAALFLARGLDAAARFVEAEHILHVDQTASALADPKTRLQELAQAHAGCTPVYVDRGSGPAHLRTFTSSVAVAGEPLAEGTGPSKKAAQQDAAARALPLLEARYECG